MKRFSGVVLLLIMLFSIVPLDLFAAESSIEGTNQTVKFIIGKKSYNVGNK